MLSAAACWGAAAMASGQQPQGPPRVRVQATGRAAHDLPDARGQAIRDALRRAVEAGAGVELSSLTATRDMALVQDVVVTRAEGYVESYEVLDERSGEGGAYTVRIEAIVRRGRLVDDVRGLATLIQSVGRPRFMVVGSASGEPFNRRLTAELNGMLRERGFDVVDLEGMELNQRRDAEAAAQGEGNVKKAALIADEHGADYLVIAAVEGMRYAPEPSHGIELYRVDATGVVKVVEADTGEVAASEQVHATARSRSDEEAARLASSRAAQEAMEQAVTQLANRWLTELYANTGRSVQLVLHEWPFGNVAELAARLRRQPSVVKVVVDESQPDARSRLRVLGMLNAEELAQLVQDLSPDVTIRGVSRHQVELAKPGVVGQWLADPGWRWVGAAGAAGLAMAILGAAGLTRGGGRGRGAASG